MGSTGSFLQIYIVVETIRLSCEYYLFNTISGVSPPSVFALSELLKIIIATIYISRRNKDGIRLWRHLRECGIQEIFRFSIPAAIDTVNSLIYFASLRFTSPALVQLFWLARLPLTAVLHHAWIKQQRNAYTWSSLVWVCVGLLLFKEPHTKFAAGNLTANFLGSYIGLFLAVSSAASNIVSENLTKSGTFWVSQFWLYTWGAVFSILSYPLTTFMAVASIEEDPFENKLATKYSFTVVYIVATATVGITSGVILRRRGNLTKLVGTVASFLISTMFLLYATLSTSNITGWSCVGGLMASFALWWYYYFQTSAPGDRISLDAEADPLMPYSGVDTEKAQAIVELGQVYMTQDDNSTLYDEPVKNISDKRELEYALFPNQESLSLRSILDAMTFGIFQNQALSTESIGSESLKFLVFLLPSFLTPGKSARTIHPTSWLDGLRGVAALFVMFHHTICNQFRRVVYGWNGDDQQLFLQLPWARLLVSGHAMVATFFVISGFSLSIGLLNRIHTHDMSSFASRLSSSVLRRYFRLFLPCLVVTFTIMLLIQFGLGRNRFDIGRFETFPVQFQHWSQDFIRFANPFGFLNLDDAVHISSMYLAVTWTIPVEFRGSMVVYIMLAACAKLRSSMRLFFFMALCLFSGWYLLWDVALFLAGMVLAELHVVNSNESKQDPSISTIENQTRGSRMSRLPSLRIVLRNSYWAAHFLFATFILGTPCEVNFPPGEGDPGYVFLWSLIPSQYKSADHPHYYFRFWPGVGAVYLVWTLDRSLFLQKIFTTRFVQYLGKISFALYLMHFQSWMVFGEPILELTYKISGQATDVQFFWGFVMGYVVYLVLTIWVSDLFNRSVDEKCVQITKWGYNKLLDNSRE